MSMLRCDSCGALIDTDDEMDAFQGDIDEWHCRDCIDSIPDDGYRWTVYQPDNTKHTHKSDRRPTLEEMQEMVGGGIFERVRIWVNDDELKDMLVNDNGHALGMDVNKVGSELYAATTFKNTGMPTENVIVGPAVVFENFMLR